MLNRRLAILALSCAMALGCAGGPRNAAEGGDAQSQFEMGAACEEGMGGETQDYPAALDWYTRAAEQGHARAQYRLGLLLADGLGTTANPEEASRWFLAAAEQELGALRASISWRSTGLARALLERLGIGALLSRRAPDA